MSTLFSPQRQLFSVPYNFVLYITENPASPKVLEKLQQTCKYFFAKNPVLIVPHLICKPNGYALKDGKENIAKMNAKFWPISTLMIHSPIDLQKFHRFSPKYLFIEFVKLSFHEFDLIVAENTVTEFGLYETAIKDATVDLVFEKLENVTSFGYENPEELYSIETLRKLSSIRRNRKMYYCRFEISASTQTLPPSAFVYLKQKTGNLEPQFEFHMKDGTSKAEFAEEIQRKNPNIFKVEESYLIVSVKFL